MKQLLRKISKLNYSLTELEIVEDVFDCDDCLVQQMMDVKDLLETVISRLGNGSKKKKHVVAKLIPENSTVI